MATSETFKSNFSEGTKLFGRDQTFRKGPNFSEGTKLFERNQIFRKGPNVSNCDQLFKNKKSVRTIDLVYFVTERLVKALAQAQNPDFSVQAQGQTIGYPLEKHD